MNITELQQLYASSAQGKALLKMLQDESLGLVFLHGLQASSAPLMLSTAIDRLAHPVLAVLQDAEQAGYFYNDLLQILGQDKVLFYPS